MSEKPQVEPDIEDDPLLTVAEAAARAGMKPSSWRSAVSREIIPAPDDHDDHALPERRRPRWRRSTVDASIGLRPGQGSRTDLRGARKQRDRQLAAELAEPRPTAPVAMDEWLRANHRHLLAVAEALVDHREVLLNAVGAELQRDELAAAIDRAGEEISSRPSRMLASAVTYALFLLRDGGPVRAVPEVREVLITHARLHPEYNHLRGEGGLA
jgi:hypothetical protein